jgi:hypothetical protein
LSQALRTINPLFPPFSCVSVARGLKFERTEGNGSGYVA